MFVCDCVSMHSQCKHIFQVRVKAQLYAASMLLLLALLQRRRAGQAVIRRCPARVADGATDMLLITCIAPPYHRCWCSRLLSWFQTQRNCGAQAAKLAAQLKVPEGALWAVSPLTRAVQTFLLARGRPGASPACDSTACTRLPAKVRPLLAAFILCGSMLFSVPEPHNILATLREAAS